jgi:hypothetical protein
MASQNAANLALGLVQLEVQVETPTDLTPEERFKELYEYIYNLHLQKGGDIGAAVATVTQAFPAATTTEAPYPADTSVPHQPMASDQYAQPQVGSGPGQVTIGFGKHNGRTIADVYREDPSYIRNYLVEKAKEADMRDACRAFLAQVDNG